MTNDIFADWKTNRFVVAGPELHEFPGCHMIIMTDFSYWSFYSDDCIAWCFENNCTIQGMTILIPSDELLTAFYLRWS